MLWMRSRCGKMRRRAGILKQGVLVRSSEGNTLSSDLKRVTSSFDILKVAFEDFLGI